MDYPTYQEVVPSAPDPPPYFEKEPYNQQPPPAYSPETPIIPTQYQRYYDASQGAGLSQGPVVQPPPHSIYVIPVQPPQPSDYLKYSIFSMLCCLPLGIAAVVYSIWTRSANQEGNLTQAHQTSRTARNLAHCALGLGIVLIKIIIICIATSL